MLLGVWLFVAATLVNYYLTYIYTEQHFPDTHPFLRGSWAGLLALVWPVAVLGMFRLALLTKQRNACEATYRNAKMQDELARLLESYNKTEAADQ